MDASDQSTQRHRHGKHADPTDYPLRPDRDDHSNRSVDNGTSDQKVCDVCGNADRWNSCRVHRLGQLKVTLRFVLDLPRLLTIFPHPVALALSLAPSAWAMPFRLAQNQLCDARLLRKTHDAASDFVVDVAYPSSGLSFPTRYAALDLAVAFRAGLLTCQRRLQVSLLFGAANFLRHQSASVEHQTLTVFGQECPSPTLSWIARRQV